jgi:hypothetical protein
LDDYPIAALLGLADEGQKQVVAEWGGTAPESPFALFACVSIASAKNLRVERKQVREC